MLLIYFLNKRISMEEHSVLYKHYSKYGGHTSDIILKHIPNIYRAANSSILRHSKEFITDTSKIVKNGVRDNIRDNFATELGQGKNPINSFMENIKKRLENEPEYIYYNTKPNKSSNKSPIPNYDHIPQPPLS